MAGAPAYTPYNMAIPGADQYAGADVMATNAYNKALTQINQNRLNTLTNYGYTGTVDPTSGVVGGVHIDPNSVYGQAQQLFHNEALDDQSAENAAEDRGLFGGLANQALGQNRYTHGAERTSLGTALQSALSDLNTQQQSAAETRDNALWQAQQAALANEMNSESSSTIEDMLSQLLNPSTDPGDTGSTPPTTGGVKAPAKPYANSAEAAIANGETPSPGSWLTGQTAGAKAKQSAVKKILRGSGARPMMKA